MRKIDYTNAKTLLTEQFGWEVTEQQEMVQIIKSDGEKEILSQEELIGAAVEMWNTAKQNGLDSAIIEEVEKEFTFTNDYIGAVNVMKKGLATIQ